MSSDLTILVFGCAWTIGSSVQAIGRWRGTESAADSNELDPIGTARKILNRQVERSLTVIPFLPGSVVILTLIRIALVHVHNSVVKVLLYLLMGLGAATLISSLILIGTLFFSGTPTFLVPPNLRITERHE